MGFSDNIILDITSDNALHDITPAVLPRARLQLRRASGNFLFKNHRFGAKIGDFLAFERLQADLRFFTFFASLCATLYGAFVPYKPIAWSNQ